MRRHHLVVLVAAIGPLTGRTAASVYSLIPSSDAVRSWQDPTNWALVDGAGNSHRYPDAVGDVAQLIAPAQATTLSFDNTIHLGQLALAGDSAGYRLSGGVLELAAPSSAVQINVAGPAAHAVEAELRLSAQTQVTVAAGSLTLSSITMQVPSLVFDGDGTSAALGSISGAGIVRKRGTGTLVLAGANAFLSTLEIEQGLVELQNRAALSSPVVLTGGTLSARLPAPASFNKLLHIEGDGVRLLSDRLTHGDGLVYGLGDLVISTPHLITAPGPHVTDGIAGLRGGHVLFEQDTTIEVRREAAAEMDFSLRILRGSHTLTKRGAGRLTITSFAHPTFDRGIRLEEGTLRAASLSPFGSGLLRMLGGTLELSTQADTPLDARISIEVPSTIILDRSTPDSGNITYSTEQVRLGAALSLAIGPNARAGMPSLSTVSLPVLVPASLHIPDRARFIAGNIAFGARLIKSGPGELVINAPAASPDAAGLDVDAGIVRLNSFSAVRGPMSIRGGSVHLDAPAAIDSAPVTVHAGQLIVQDDKGLLNSTVQMLGGILELATAQSTRHETSLSIAADALIRPVTRPPDAPLVTHTFHRLDLDAGTLHISAGPLATNPFTLFADFTTARSADLDIGDNASLTLAQIRFSGQLRRRGAGTLHLVGPAEGTGALRLEGGLTTVQSAGVALPPSVIVTGGELRVGDPAQFTPATHLSAASRGQVHLEGRGVYTLASLSVGDEARVDLEAGALVLSSTDLTSLRAALIAGRASPTGGAPNGRWNGESGIVSSSLASLIAERGREEMAMGYLANARSPLGPLQTFLGQPVDPEEIFLRQTRNGDANLDGRVDASDVTVVAGFYRPSADAQTPVRHWYEGDFNYDGRVDNSDVTILAGFYAPHLPAANASVLTAVPEPAVLWIPLLLLLPCRCRRRGRRGRRRCSRVEFSNIGLVRKR